MGRPSLCSPRSRPTYAAGVRHWNIKQPPDNYHFGVERKIRALPEMNDSVGKFAPIPKVRIRAAKRTEVVPPLYSTRTIRVNKYQETMNT